MNETLVYIFHANTFYHSYAKWRQRYWSTLTQVYTNQSEKDWYTLVLRTILLIFIFYAVLMNTYKGMNTPRYIIDINFANVSWFRFITIILLGTNNWLFKASANKKYQSYFATPVRHIILNMRWNDWRIFTDPGEYVLRRQTASHYQIFWPKYITRPH